MSDENTDNPAASQPVTAVAQVAKDLMDLAKNDENTVIAAKHFGQSAVIISKTVRNCLLPLAAVNYRIEKAKHYFEQYLKKDLEEKTQSIPAENIIEPKSSIAGPALQGLAFSHEEPDLKDMYLNLLSSAMNTETADDTHPAFVEIIKQLSSTEAKMLEVYIKNSAPNAIGKVIYSVNGTSYQFEGNKHILSLYLGTEPYYNKHIPSYVDNWVRLGLVEVRYDLALKENYYEEIIQRQEFIQDNRGPGDNCTKSFGKGLIRRTTFGAQFAAIVGLAE